MFLDNFGGSDSLREASFKERAQNEKGVPDVLVAVWMFTSISKPEGDVPTVNL